ncbi:hypothetical protein CBL_20536 [Carabus blaptoides fortunei]
MYAIGDTVVVEKPVQTMEGSKKLAPIYDGPMKIIDVLDNDRYVVRNTREGYRKKKYESVYSVDKMKNAGAGWYFIAGKSSSVYSYWLLFLLGCLLQSYLPAYI